MSYHEILVNFFISLLSITADLTILLIGIYEFTGWTPFKGRRIKEDVVPQVADTWSATSKVADKALGLLDKYITTPSTTVPVASAQTAK